MFNSCRPGFLPDPNDGSLYVLGGKRKEGLMVSITGIECTANVFEAVTAHVIYINLLCRNSRSLFQNWSSLLPAGALMECSTRVTSYMFVMFYGEISV